MAAQAVKRFLVCVMLCAMTACAPKVEAPKPSPYAAPAQPHPYSHAAPASPSARTPVPQPSPLLTRSSAGQVKNYPEIRVGLLLPLSGKSAELGQSMLDAAMLGLFDKYAALPAGDATPRIVLLPKDTGDDPKQAAAAAKAVIDEGAKLILGPLFSDAVNAVVPVAAASGVNVISFSNNTAVAGKNSFLFGFLPAEQVKRVVAEAHKKGHEHIAALLPMNDYGTLIAETLQDYAALHGFALAGVVRYPSNATDLTPYIQQLKTGEQGKPRTIDALFLAESGATLTVLIDRLKVYELGNDKVKYLGTGLWDDPTLVGNKDMLGSWFASSPMQSYNGFVSRFENTQQYTPPRLASLGYDAVALAATLAASGGFDTANITHQSGYEGPANGIFRFHANGTIERGLSVLTFTPSGKMDVTVAPRMFYHP
jgi:branched-chain amino acid transport system substrate-binding protein